MNTIGNAESATTSHVNDELLSIAEVAVIVRVPEATLRYWRHLRTGPHSFRIGRSVRYWHNDIVGWLDEQSNDPQEPR